MITAIALIDADVASIPEVCQQVAALPGVSEVYSVTGDTDLIAMVRVRRHEDFADDTRAPKVALSLVDTRRQCFGFVEAGHQNRQFDVVGRFHGHSL